MALHRLRYRPSNRFTASGLQRGRPSRTPFFLARRLEPVNDFAHVLTPVASRNIEDLCTEVHQQADAELVVVTVKTPDDGQSIEEFTAALEEKWKIGKKGEDRSALIVLSLDPKRLRVETGYGLEGILNDAKVGRILDPAVPLARSGNYDHPWDRVRDPDRDPDLHRACRVGVLSDPEPAGRRWRRGWTRRRPRRRVRRGWRRQFGRRWRVTGFLEVRVIQYTRRDLEER
jgi:hypothetical protein